jgi:hypothetical protein
MAQTETRPGFRLPWTAEHGDPPQNSDAGTPETAETDQPSNETNPAQEPVTPDMIDATATAPARRPTKFMAELGKAMQVAAETARDETLARVVADQKVVVEEIHAQATVEAADLRRRADDDVAAVREWSKAEIARVREETEARITLRKTSLDGEMEYHTGAIAARVEQVGAAVAAFEAEMAQFFERLRAEGDPTRIATMAEAMPDPPDLANVASLIGVPTTERAFDPAWIASPDAAATDAVETGAPEAPVATEAVEATAASDGVESVDGETVEAVAGSEATEAAEAVVPSEPDFAAAEAEAASFTGDAEDEAQPPATTVAEHEEADSARLAATDESSMPIERATSRVVVVGLVSVASIATFKRSLGRVTGVSAIGVASGPDGEFVFTVSHDATLNLSEAISGLPGFEAQVTAETDGALQVTAHDPDTGA